MESPDIRAFVGIGSPTDFESVRAALAGLEAHEQKLREVVDDIGPATGQPVLADSRKVTVYSKVLMSADALRAKREERGLGTAQEIVSRDSMTGRLTSRG